MPGSTPQPTGFCPQCDYPTNPGRCPECGLDIPADKLLARPEHVRLRRSLTRLLLILLLLSLVSAAYYGNRYYHFIRWVPARVLLAVQSDEGTAPRTELHRRFQANELNEQEAKKYLLSMLGAPNLSLETRQPVDAPVRFRLSYENPLTLPVNTYFLSVAGLRMFVDGQDVPTETLSRTLIPHLAGKCLVTGPRLAPGGHEIVVEGTVALNAVQFGPQKATLVVERPFRLSGTLATEGDATQYIQQTANAATVWAIWHRLGAAAVRRDRTGRGGAIWLRAASTGIPIAATVLVRPSGSDAEYREVGQISLSEFVDHERVRVDNFYAPSRGARLDIRLVPDPSAAWSSGNRRCFSGVIEWREVPLVRGQLGHTGEETLYAHRLTYQRPDHMVYSVAAPPR